MFCRICKSESNLKFSEQELRREIKKQRRIGQQVIRNAPNVGNICKDCDYRLQNYAQFSDEEILDVDGDGDVGIPTPPEENLESTLTLSAKMDGMDLSHKTNELLVEKAHNENVKLEIVDLSYDSDGEKENNNNNAWSRNKKLKRKQKFDESNFRIVGSFVLSSDSESEPNEDSDNLNQTKYLLSKNTPPPTPTPPPTSPSSLQSLKDETFESGTCIKEKNNCSKSPQKEKSPDTFIALICPECNLRFPDEDTLAVHSQIHSADSIKCPCCDLMFTMPLRLVSHMRRKHLSYEGGILKERPRQSTDGAMTIRLRYKQHITFYECQLCGRIDDVYKSHNDHIISSHPDEAKSLRTNKRNKTKKKSSPEELISADVKTADNDNIQKIINETSNQSKDINETVADVVNTEKNSALNRCLDISENLVDEITPKKRKSKDKSLSCPVCKEKCGLDKLELCRHLLSNHHLDEYKSHLREINPEKYRSRVSHIKKIRKTANVFKYGKCHSIYFQCRNCSFVSGDCPDHLKHLRIHKNTDKLQRKHQQIEAKTQKKKNEISNQYKKLPLMKRATFLVKLKRKKNPLEPCNDEKSSEEVPAKNNNNKKDEILNKKLKKQQDNVPINEMKDNDLVKEVQSNDLAKDKKTDSESSPTSEQKQETLPNDAKVNRNSKDRSLGATVATNPTNASNATGAIGATGGSVANSATGAAKKRKKDKGKQMKDILTKNVCMSDTESSSPPAKKMKKEQNKSLLNKLNKTRSLKPPKSKPLQDETTNATLEENTSLKSMNKRQVLIMKGGKISKKAVKAALIKVKVKPPIKTIPAYQCSCKFCTFVGKSFMSLNRHLLANHSMEEFSNCNICLGVLPNLLNEEKHKCSKRLGFKQSRKLRPSQEFTGEESISKGIETKVCEEKSTRDTTHLCFKCGSLLETNLDLQEHNTKDHSESDIAYFRQIVNENNSTPN